MKKIIYVFLFGILLVLGGCMEPLNFDFGSNPIDLEFGDGPVHWDYSPILTIWGYVNQSDGSGIPDAKVITYPETDVVFTHYNGQFGINNGSVIPGSYTVEASKDGYISNSVEINVSDSSNNYVIITLSKVITEDISSHK